MYVGDNTTTYTGIQINNGRNALKRFSIKWRQYGNIFKLHTSVFNLFGQMLVI